MAGPKPGHCRSYAISQVPKRKDAAGEPRPADAHDAGEAGS